MINEPKPCPFHEEPIIPDTLTGLDQGNGNPGSGGWWATVECPDCGNGFTEIECSTEDGALELVINEWNTRYERTCHFFESFDRDIWGEDGSKQMLEEYLAPPQPATMSTMDLPDCYECSACAWQVKQKPPAWMKCCANCGAEVTDD